MKVKSQGATGSRKGPNKMGGVRTALGQLGNDAMPSAIQEFLKKELKIDMTPEHISNYKSEILRKQRALGAGGSTSAGAASNNGSSGASESMKGGMKAAPKAAPKTASKPASTPKAAPQSMASTGQGAHVVSLEDIRAVKGLVGRVGAGHLKSLIDVFEK